jgi:hypothetical protein
MDYRELVKKLDSIAGLTEETDTDAEMVSPSADIDPSILSPEMIAAIQKVVTDTMAQHNVHPSKATPSLTQQLDALDAGQEKNNAAMSPNRREAERRASLDQWDMTQYGHKLNAY